MLILLKGGRIVDPVNGRDEIPLAQKVGYDREYLARVSPLRDLAILLRTAVVLFSDRGTF